MHYNGVPYFILCLSLIASIQCVNPDKAENLNIGLCHQFDDHQVGCQTIPGLNEAQKASLNVLVPDFASIEPLEGI